MPETKKTKIDFIQSLPEWIENHRATKDIYFYTVTFKEPKLKLPFDYYREFFRYQRQKFDNALLSNSKSYAKAPFLILLPEENPYLHFHGLMCIHKETSNKFYRKCVSKISHEFIEKLHIQKPSLHLNEKFINPYPRSLYFRNEQASAIKQIRNKHRTPLDKKFLAETQPLLTIADYKLYPISNEKELYAASFYSGKRYARSDFSSDEIIIETKLKSDKVASASAAQK